MNARNDILAAITAHQEEIARRFGVRHLAVFGSAARDEMREGSDVDVLVEFVGEPTFDAYMDLKFFLEGLLDTPVDLVTKDAVKPRMRPVIERDMIRVA